jgi:putative MATE family efflux protein
MNDKRAELLGKYPVKKLLVKLAVPATAGMMVNALYNLVDTFYVARGAGEVAIGALTFAFPVQMIIMAVGLMIGIGSASVFSRAYGRNDREKMNNVVNTAIRIDALLALVLAIIGFIFLDQLLTFFGASASNIGYAKDYLSVILIGLVPLSLSMVLNNLTRAEGRVNIAMYAMMLGAGTNILIDPLFIFDEVTIFGSTIQLLGLGVRGAGIATVLSQLVSFSYILSKTFSKDSQIRVNFKNWFDIHFETVKDIIVIGMPTFLRNSLGAFIAILILKLINFYSVGDPDIYQSVYGVINKMIFFIFMPGFGIVQGLAPIVGFNYGAKNYERIREVIIYAAKIVATYLIGGFIFVQIFATTIFTVFSKNNDLFFIEYGSSAFRIVSYGFLLVTFQFLVSSVYQSLGYPKRALLVAISRQTLIFVPLVFLTTYFYGLDGIWYSYAASDLLAGLLGLGMLIYELRVFKKIIAKEKATSLT